jgi:hypothetical protein
MKKTLAIAAVFLLAAGLSYADSLQVLGAPDITPLEGNYSLVVNHDDSSIVYVQDDTPEDETIYRAEFLYNPNDIQATTTSPGPWRQMIFRGFSIDRNGCTPQPYMNAFMLYDLHWGSVGANCSMILWGRGNVCGQQGTTRVDIPCNSASKICLEFKSGASQTGLLAVAAVTPGNSCPTSGDPAWKTKTMTNNSMRIEFVRLGATNRNNFGRGEDGSWLMDSFASFRTVNP